MDRITVALTLYGNYHTAQWDNEETLFQVENNNKLDLEYRFNIKSYLESDTKLKEKNLSRRYKWL